MRKIKYIILVLFSLFVLTGCEDAMRNWTDQLAENLKNAIKETWYIWLIVAIIIAIPSIFISIARHKARVKFAKKVKEKIDQKKKKNYKYKK